QAEVWIGGRIVPGVQTCGLPIWSSPADASQSPVGLVANARTGSVWLSKVRRRVPVVGFHRRISRSSPAEASQSPAGPVANAWTRSEERRVGNGRVAVVVLHRWNT